MPPLFFCRGRCHIRRFPAVSTPGSFMSSRLHVSKQLPCVPSGARKPQAGVFTKGIKPQTPLAQYKKAPVVGVETLVNAFSGSLSLPALCVKLDTKLKFANASFTKTKPHEKQTTLCSNRSSAEKAASPGRTKTSTGAGSARLVTSTAGKLCNRAKTPAPASSSQVEEFHSLPTQKARGVKPPPQRRNAAKQRASDKHETANQAAHQRLEGRQKTELTRLKHCYKDLFGENKPLKRIPDAYGIMEINGHRRVSAGFRLKTRLVCSPSVPSGVLQEYRASDLAKAVPELVRAYALKNDLAKLLQLSSIGSHLGEAPTPSKP